MGFARVATLLCTVLTESGAAAAPASGQGQTGAETGRVEGMVLLDPSLSARKMRFRVYADAGSGSLAPPSAEAASELSNVVVYLDSVSWTGPAPLGSGQPFAMEQVDERFVPHVLAVLKGSTVEFPNRDPVFHNVFSLSRARSFDLGRYPQGASKSARFDKPGIVQVFCHIHSDMSGVIVVLDNPFFAVPDSAGRFAIQGIPPGEHRFVAWHERTRPVEQRIRILAGQTAEVHFRIPLAQDRE